jgi:hypothetical protein
VNRRPGVRAENAAGSRVSMTAYYRPDSVNWAYYLLVSDRSALAQSQDPTYLQMFSLATDTALPDPHGTQ